MIDLLFVLLPGLPHCIPCDPSWLEIKAQHLVPNACSRHQPMPWTQFHIDLPIPRNKKNTCNPVGVQYLYVFIPVKTSEISADKKGQKKTIEHQLNHIKSYFTLFHIINWWEKQWFPEFSVNFPLNQSIDIRENRCQKRHPSRPREVCWSSTASERWPLPRMASRLPRLERRRAAFFGLVTWCLMMFNDA